MIIKLHLFEEFNRAYLKWHTDNSLLNIYKSASKYAYNESTKEFDTDTISYYEDDEGKCVVNGNVVCESYLDVNRLIKS